jgi:putative transposase
MALLSDKEKQLIALISEECTSPGDVTAKLKNLFAGTLERMLEAEMDEHLGYEKNSVAGNNSGNSRNGHYTPKTIKANGAKPRLPFPEIAMARSNRKQLANGKPVLTK